MIHPNIEKLSDDDVDSIVKGDYGCYEINKQGLSSAFMFCMSLYFKGFIRDRSSDSFRVSQLPLNYPGATHIVFGPSYRDICHIGFICHNTCNFNTILLKLINKDEYLTLFGFRNLNLYVISKIRNHYYDESKGARKFLSAMHYLADDLENGVSNRIYYVK